MKTTVEIPDTLLEEAKRIAARQDTTLRVLIIDGLRRVVADRKSTRPFRLRKASFRGNGLQPGVESATWDQIRDMAYEKHGG